MSKYSHLNHGSGGWRCVPCVASFESAGEFNEHCAEVDVAAHRFCPSCNIVFPTLKRFHEHHANGHDMITIVSPEAKKIKKEVKKEKKEAKMSPEEKARKKAAKKQQKEAKAQKKAEKKKWKEEKKKAKLQAGGPITCHICSKKCAMPGDYAQHLESGTRKHGKVNRHHITQAVQMLGVVPPIIITPSIEFHSPTLTGYDDAITSSLADAPSIVEAGPPLSFREEAASFGPAVPEFELPAQGMHLMPFTNSPFDSFPSYTPNDFIHLGIPYACPLCLKTFRNVNQLTAHMNSPAHDPDAFKCPEPKCGRQFALVSGLIQHLQSGKCGLASGGEGF